MKEIACQFGSFDRLIGVMSSPDRNTSDTALALVSAGFTAKSGPYRVYTDIARSLARKGVLSLRFDLGGVGDSQTLHPTMPLAKRTTADIKAALDYLEESQGIRRFVIGGLCSGAEDAIRYAAIDQRVVGVVLIDGHAYRTTSWWLYHAISRNFYNRAICRVLRMLGLLKFSYDDRPSGVLSDSLIDYEYMELPEASRLIRELVARRTQLHYIYTGGRKEEFNHPGQFPRMFSGVDFADCLTLDHIPTIAHTQVFDEDRQALIDVVTRRVLSTAIPA